MSGGFNFFRQSFVSKSNKKGHDIIYDSSVYDTNNKLVKTGNKVKIGEIIGGVVSLFKERVDSLVPKGEQVLVNTEEYVPGRWGIIQTLGNFARRGTENTGVSEKVLSTLRKYALAAGAILGGTAGASAAYGQDFIVGGQAGSLERSIDDSDSLRIKKDLSFKSTKDQYSNGSLIGNTGKSTKGTYGNYSQLNQDFGVPSTGYDVLRKGNRSQSGGGSFKLNDKTTVSGNTSGDSKFNSTSGSINYNTPNTYAELSLTFGSNVAPKLKGVLAQVIKLNNGNDAGAVMKVSISAKSYRLLTGSAQFDIGKDGRLTIGVAHLQSMIDMLNSKFLMKTDSQIIDYEEVMAFSEFIQSMRFGIFHSKTGDKLNAQIQSLVEKNETFYRSYDRITNLRGADSYNLYAGVSGDFGSQYTPFNLTGGIKWDRFNGTLSDKIGPSISFDTAYIWGDKNQHKIYGELDADLLRVQTDGGYLYKQDGVSVGPRLSNIAQQGMKPEQRIMLDLRFHTFDQGGHVTSNRVSSDLDLSSSIRGILNSLLMLKPISKDPLSYLEFLLNQRDLISSADFLPITFVNYSKAVDLARSKINQGKLSKDQLAIIIDQVEKSRSQLTFNSSDLRGTLSSFISSGTLLSGENFTKETWSKYRQALVEGEIILNKGSRKKMTAYDVAHSQGQKMLDNTSHRIEKEVIEKNKYWINLKKLPEGSFMTPEGDLKIPLLVNNVKSIEGVFPGDQSHFSIEGNYLRISDIGNLKGGAQYFMIFLLNTGNYWIPDLTTTHGSVEIGIKTKPEITFKKGPTEVPPDPNLVMDYVTGKISEAGINTIVSQINASKSKLKAYSEEYEKIKDTSSLYTTESWIKYAQSIITAREVLNKNSTLPEIDAAEKGVAAAKGALVPEQSLPTSPTITGIANGGTYGSDVSVTVSDSAGTKSTLILDGASYTSGTPITAEGKHTLEIKTTKLSNGKTITQTLTFTIEKTLPTSPTITGIVNGGTYGNDVSLIVTDLSGSTSTITLDGTAYTSGTAITTEGKHTLVIKTTKASNGKEISQTLTFTIDKTSPTSPTITGVSNGGTYGNDVSVVITDADGSTSIITLDGTAYTSGTAITSDGKHTLIITTTKTSNGKIITQTLSFTIDKAAPSNPTVSGVSNGITYGNDVTPSWSDASGTTSTATLNGSPHASGTPITTDGSYTLVITTKALNGKTNTQTITFIVDKVTPSNPTISGISNGTTYGVNVTPSWNDAVGTTSTATLNGTPYASGTPITTDGNYTLVVTTTKASNGKTNTQTITFTLDKAAPSNPTVSGVLNGTTYGVNVTPSWSNVGGTTSTATLNGTPYVSGTPITTDGNYTLVVTTTKASNGTTNTQTITFTVDKAAPSNPTVSGITNGNRYVDTATPSWSNAGGTTSTATLDGNAYTSGTAVTTGGSHILVVTTTKTSNGTTNTQTITFTVDKTPSVPTGTELQSQAITNSRDIELGMPPTAGITHWLVMDVPSGGTCTPPSASDPRWTTDLFRYTLTSSGEGPKKVCIFVKSGDAVQPTPDTVNVELDIINKAVDKDLGTIDSSSSIAQTLTFDEKIKVIEVIAGGSSDIVVGTTSVFSTSLAISGTAGSAGQKEKYIKVVDEAGNEKTIKIYFVSSDPI